MCLRWIVYFALVLVGGAGTGLRTAAAADAKGRPNVIVIVADDLGYADVGAQGISKDVRTPHLDSIATGGARFTSAYVTAPVCAPSRAGLLTGRYQTRFGFELNPGGVDYPNYGLPQTEVPLPEVMRKAGYRTGMMGKWHLGNRKERAPLARGFDEFYGFWGGLHSYTRQSKGWNAIRLGEEPFPEKEYLTTAIGREGSAFIDRNHDKPFFLYVAFNAPHQPMEVPPGYVKPFEHVKDRKRRLMLAMVSAMDDAVGQLLETLRQHQLEENTLVFFTSDNGGPTDGNASLNNPFSGYKHQLFEGGIRVPLLAQWKGRVRPGTVIEQPVNLLDLFATAVAAGGADVPKGRVIDGVNLMPWLEGKKSEPVHERLYWRYKPQWAVREGDWKLMGVGDKVKLFNLARDPGEKADLSGEHPEMVQRLRAAHAAWAKDLQPPMWEPDDPSQMDAEAFDRQESPHKTGARRRGPGPVGGSTRAD